MTKWLELMIKKYGSEEAVSEHMAELARKQKGSKKPKSGVASLSKEEQSRRGREAAMKRWHKTEASN